MFSILMMCIFVLVLLDISHSTPCYSLDGFPGTLWNGTRCLKHFSDSDQKYEQGNEYCKTHFHSTATLAKADHSEIAMVLQNLWNATTSWIGLKDETGAWGWRWQADNTPITTYAAWAIMDPSGDGDCVAFREDAFWDDRPCDDELSIFCSYELFSCWNVSLPTLSCSGHGVCVSEDNCSCHSCYDGDRCDVGPYCYGLHNEHMNSCGAWGVCIDCDKCLCFDRSFGVSCGERVSIMGIGDVSTGEVSISYEVSWDIIPGSSPSVYDIAVRCEDVILGGNASLCWFKYNPAGPTNLNFVVPSGQTHITVRSLTKASDTLSVTILWSSSSLQPYVIGIIVVGGISILCTCVILVVACWIFCRRRDTKRAVEKFVQAHGIDDVDLVLKEESLQNTTANFTIDKKLFFINYDDLTIMKKIGSGGGDAVVFKADWKGSPVAFKCFRVADVFLNDSLFAEFEKEASLLMAISHPHIIRVFGCTIKSPRVGIVMELCDNGDLSMYLQSHPDTPLSIRIVWLAGVAAAISHIHSVGVIHRDIKPDNVFLDHELISKLADFGLGRSIGDHTACVKTRHVGTLGFISPEVVSGTTYNEACDVYSFGVTMYAVLTGKFKPYGSQTNVDYRSAMDPAFRPEIDDIECGVLDVIVSCWKHDPAERPRIGVVAERLASK